MILLVGLGNPGRKYAKNRHNIGFMAIDDIADVHHFPTFKSKFQAEISAGNIGSQKVLLLKPQTYMNDSGYSVAQAAKFYKIPPEQIIVFHDELDLQPGKMRIKSGGGVAGHNGLKSMQSHLGTADFIRVRLGIGHPGEKEKVTGHVLNDFSAHEQIWLTPLLKSMAEHLDLLLSGAFEDSMSKIAHETQV